MGELEKDHSTFRMYVRKYLGFLPPPTELLGSMSRIRLYLPYCIDRPLVSRSDRFNNLVAGWRGGGGYTRLGRVGLLLNVINAVAAKLIGTRQGLG